MVSFVISVSKIDLVNLLVRLMQKQQTAITAADTSDTTRKNENALNTHNEWMMLYLQENWIKTYYFSKKTFRSSHFISLIILFKSSETVWRIQYFINALQFHDFNYVTTSTCCQVLLVTSIRDENDCICKCPKENQLGRIVFRRNLWICNRLWKFSLMSSKRQWTADFWVKKRAEFKNHVFQIPGLVFRFDSGQKCWKSTLFYRLWPFRYFWRECGVWMVRECDARRWLSINCL